MLSSLKHLEIFRTLRNNSRHIRHVAAFQCNYNMIGSCFHYFLCISHNVFHLFFTFLLDVFHFSFLFLDYFKSTFPSYYIQNITTLFCELPTYYQQFYLIPTNIIRLQRLRLQIFYLHKSKPLCFGFRSCFRPILRRKY